MMYFHFIFYIPTSSLKQYVKDDYDLFKNDTAFISRLQKNKILRALV